MSTPRLKTKYREEIIPALEAEFNYANLHNVAGLQKIVVNMGVGEAARDSKVLDGAVADLTAITGQKPADHQGEEVHRTVQAARGPADWMPCHPSR